MSKFFEALEQAEQERLARESADKERQGEARPAAESVSRLSEPESTFRERAVAKPPERPAEPRRQWAAERVSHEGPLEDHLVSLLTPTSAEAEQYRTLCCAVEEAHNASGLHVIAVTSAGVGEGKTLTAINMAATLAQTPETRVLLIEADLRQPSIANRLGLDDFDGPGFIEAIQNPSSTLKSVARKLPTFNMSVLTAGDALESPYETLKSPRVEALINEARGDFDYIVVDTPPVIPVPDCRVIARWVEAFIVIVAAHQTPRKLLEETLNALEPNKVFGLVFNRDDEPLADYYGYSYAYGYGKQKQKRKTWNDRVGRKLAASRSPYSAT
jgi:capsular exopolysaccharide synthesis family protein